MDDLYPLDMSLNTKLLHEKFSQNIDYSKLKGDKYGLLKALLKTLKAHLLMPVVPRLAQLAFTFSQPFFIEKLLGYLNQPQVPANVGYGFIGASILIYSGIAISTALCMYPHHRMRAMARSILVTETFIKATEAQLGADERSAAVTLMSTDIERIKLGFRMIHNVWAGVIQAALAGWMLYIRLGAVFAVPIGIVTFCFLCIGVLLNLTGDSQRSWMAGVEKRVGLTAAVISSMKNLKISGLSSTVGDFVQKLRVEELAAGARFRKIFILAALCGFTPMLLSPPLTIGFSQNTLDTQTVFSSLSFLVLLTNPLSQIFQALPEIISGLACIGRIQAFLECETRHDFRRVLGDRGYDLKPESLSQTTAADPEKSEKSIRPDFAVESDSVSSEAKLESEDSAFLVRDGNFGWEADTLALQNVNVRIAKSSLTMVVGPVGSGKSTLCKVLLGEIPVSEGSVVLGTRAPHVGFCDQMAFIYNGTIRDNIIGFSPIDEQRYDEVIRATALGYDLSVLAQGDRTVVGSDGIMLSGGQKQRISLARALYLQSDLLVLDDIFSGLDADTEQEVFRLTFGPNGLLKQRRSTVVLCTHSVKYLPSADHVIVLEDGRVVEQGDYKSLMTGQGYVERLGLTASSGRDSELDEVKSTTDTAESKSYQSNATVARPAAVAGHTEQSRPVGERTVFKHYFKSMGWVLAGFCLFFAALWGFFTNFPTVWLSFWTDDLKSTPHEHSQTYYVGIYVVLQVLAMLSLLLLGILIFIVSVKRAGANLHQETLRTLIHAPLHYITRTDAGVITNLFSQDLNLIDTELPDALLNTLFCLSQAIGQAAVMLTSSAYLAISYPFIAVVLYAIQKFYLRTSRQLRLLDLETKSPLYTHFLDTLKGITTLRAFGFIPKDITKNAHLLDSSQRAAYLLVMIQEWLNLVLDLLVMVMAAVLTTLAVRLHSSAGFAGASLVTLLSLGENLLKTFNETVKPEERDDEDVVPVASWPQHGAVEFEGVSASYRVNSQGGDNNGNQDEDDLSDLALADIRLAIKPREKIAICGRTGSGKSSLIALLLKLLEPVPKKPGRVVLDGVPLKSVDRTTLRQRIIAVPQEAVFLPDGTSFRANLDPAGLSTVEECQSVLAAVGLSSFVQERGGLDAGMSAGTLSAGQRQLMSLGRAVLRRRIRGKDSGGILLLDEVSSSVDVETERAMQQTIQVEFEGYTVIAVSHRLDMIMDFDRVVVMDKGEIVEVGQPRALADTMGTRFGGLVKSGAN
ncbi:ABC transporter [Colletotrichum sp. SAR 10_66]|nr:ABC transporter [Colletotrichum sp. SAR 10_66]